MTRKLVWTEGLFVTQHHFQQLDRYHESLLNERIRSLAGYDWGLTEIDVDERSLASNQLRITRLSGVLPDGTLLRCAEGKRDAIQPRSFAAEFTPQLPTLDVYVALVQEADGAANIDLDGTTAQVARFGRVQEKVADANTGSGEQTLDCARPLVRVLFGDEVKGLFDAIRIAQLVRSPQGAVQLKATHVPPVLRIRASSYLMNQLRGILTIMTARQRALAQARRQRSAGAVEVDPSDMLRFLFLDLLNASIPQFAHLVDAGHAHPEQAYMMLGSLIGRLCSFTDEADPSAIPPFIFLELGSVFEPMFNLVLNLLNTIISDRYNELPLQRRDDGVYVAKASAQEIMQSQFFLAVSGTLPEAQVRERLPKLMKVASVNQIGAILKSAICGAQIELEYRPPAALPVKPGISFFRVTRNPPEFWSDIAASGTLALYHPFDPQALKLALYSVDSSSAT
jgi:type VI secretion system protein ImpJ